jgi:hypothetical protein
MRSLRVCLTLLLFTLLPWPAAAQFETATVVGTNTYDPRIVQLGVRLLF